MGNKLFLTLEDAVMIVCDRMQLEDDRDWARSELEQGRFVPSDQYIVGYDQAREDLIKLLSSTIELITKMDAPGRWRLVAETDEYGMKRPKLVCSKCGKEPAAWDSTELFDFCPNCGTKMRRDIDEE